MIFECLNRPFGHVAVVVVKGNKFVGHAGCLNGRFVLRQCLRGHRQPLRTVSAETVIVVVRVL